MSFFPNMDTSIIFSSSERIFGFVQTSEGDQTPEISPGLCRRCALYRKKCLLLKESQLRNQRTV